MLVAWTPNILGNRMFGMLDYRAHKLLWLLSLPYRMTFLVVFYGFVIITALVVHSQLGHYHPALQILIAWACVELPGSVLFTIINWIALTVISKVFFWFIDVVPAHGKNRVEAKAVVLQGNAYTLLMKLENHIDDWTDDDTDAYVALMNWRARWFFPVRDRAAYSVNQLKQIYHRDNVQPWQLPKKTVDSITASFPGKKVDWIEKLFVSPYGFYPAVRLALVVLIIMNVR